MRKNIRKLEVIVQESNIWKTKDLARESEENKKEENHQKIIQEKFP